MGGESNFMFAYTSKSPCKLEAVPMEEWQLPEMRSWTEENVKALLDVAEAALKECVATMNLPVNVLRKERAVGIYPEKGTRLAREQLEETVLVVQRVLEMSDAGKRIPFCAFNGGNDVSNNMLERDLPTLINSSRSSSISATKAGASEPVSDSLATSKVAALCT
jgi:IMP and pyridine-specific 5'-nucleotidase